MKQESFLLILGIGKRSRGILLLCVIIVVLLVTFVIAAWNLPAGGSTTVGQTLNISDREITRIDISNGSGPVAHVTDKGDIDQLINPFMQIRIQKISAFKTSFLNQQMHMRTGAEGLYYVVYKQDIPYMHMEYFKPKLFNICPNDQAQNKVFYSTSDSIDSDSINSVLIKYHINRI